MRVSKIVPEKFRLMKSVDEQPYPDVRRSYEKTLVFLSNLRWLVFFNGFFHEKKQPSQV